MGIPIYFKAKFAIETSNEIIEDCNSIRAQRREISDRLSTLKVRLSNPSIKVKKNSSRN